MNTGLSERARSPVFYGWIVLAGAVLAQLVIGGTFAHSFGVFLPEIAEDTGWSRASLSVVFSFGIMAFGFLSPLWGILVTRFGPRKCILAGNSVAALGVASLYLVQEIWHFYILYTIVGLGAGLAGLIATTTLANNWFIKRIPLVMGIIAAAGGMAGFIFPPLTAGLITSIGWRHSWLVLAATVAVGAVIIGGWLMVRNRPEEKGQAPDGVFDRKFVPAVSPSGLSQPVEPQARLQSKKMLRIPSFWFIGIFAAASGFAIGTITTHQVAYLQDLGFSSITASTTLSLASGFSVVSALVYGVLALKFKVRILTGAAFIVQLMALTILLTSKELAWLYVYSALLGTSFGALVAALPTVVGVYFGRTHFAQIVGMIFSFHILAYAGGGPLAGIIFDTTGTYLPAFICVMAFSLLGLTSVILIRKIKSP